jgi:hypothetical protein
LNPAIAVGAYSISILLLPLFVLFIREDEDDDDSCWVPPPRATGSVTRRLGLSAVQER